MEADTDDTRIAAALERNDRYVREFVEAYNLCPYAKRCRETGKLHRTVLLDQGGAPGTAGFAAAVDSLSAAIARFERMPPESIEVGLVLLPALVPALAEGVAGARAFEQLVGAARARIQARPDAGAPDGDTMQGGTLFYCVPFHPHFAEDLGDAHRAVRFIRRSPDPTLQLVNASVLRAARGAGPGGERHVDITGLSAAELMVITAPVSLSDGIARANWRTVIEAGPDRLRALLAAFREKGPGSPSPGAA